ncbi:hypothetical protein T484DRAFT_1756114 [Baffinella frigidus]|nr:hypothetical protein T484DRAFT_1756114 [Cryptophyta sp. CCMP2293]
MFGNQQFHPQHFHPQHFHPEAFHHEFGDTSHLGNVDLNGLNTRLHQENFNYWRHHGNRSPASLQREPHVMLVDFAKFAHWGAIRDQLLKAYRKYHGDNLWWRQNYDANPERRHPDYVHDTDDDSYPSSPVDRGGMGHVRYSGNTGPAGYSGNMGHVRYSGNTGPAGHSGNMGHAGHSGNTGPAGHTRSRTKAPGYWR